MAFSRPRRRVVDVVRTNFQMGDHPLRLARFQKVIGAMAQRPEAGHSSRCLVVNEDVLYSMTCMVREVAREADRTSGFVVQSRKQSVLIN
jgi:hypothetical protein